MATGGEGLCLSVPVCTHSQMAEDPRRRHTQNHVSPAQKWQSTVAHRRVYRPRGAVPWPGRNPLRCALWCHVPDGTGRRRSLTSIVRQIRARRAAFRTDADCVPAPLPCRDEFRVAPYERVQDYEVHVAVHLTIDPSALVPCASRHSTVPLYPSTQEGLYVYPVRDLLPWQVRTLDAFHHFRGRRACACANDDEAFTQRALELFLSACVRVPYSILDVPNCVLDVYATLASSIHARIKT